MTPEETKDECFAQLVYFTLKAKRTWPNLNITAYPIKYNLKGTCVGQAIHAETPHIRLNLAMLQDNPHEIAQVVPHELAHIINRELNQLFRPAPHGDSWKRVMWRLGVEPTRCHSVDTDKYSTQRKTRKFKYHCTCGKFYLIGPKRHKTCQSGSKRYSCRSCETDLREMRVTDLGLT